MTGRGASRTISSRNLKHWLDAELGRASSIFFDVRDIETGEAWPYRLADGLAHSKAMVCL
jgi:hypothetical protein